MRLQQWAANGWLRPHQTTPGQIADLLAIVERDIKDSERDLSPDWQFGIAYNATLKLCTILLYASGCRPGKNLAHYRTLQSLPLILGSQFSADADYLDSCRAKRNTAEYDAAGTVSQSESDELRAFTHELRTHVLQWLLQNHPTLIGAP
ncbi:MAG: hypothetical protein NTW21_14555 [Verrucomicrobia bacterium]|nr:hypothetical protein [Verrucomicrobiota bacterium]